MRRFNFGKDKHDGEKNVELVPFGRFNINSLFEDFFSEPLFGGFGILKSSKTPAIDVYEKGNTVVVKADLPGIKKENIKLHLDGDILTISGETKEEREEKKEGYYYSERALGRVQRTIRLPEGVKQDQIKASYKDGVITIEVPRSEEAVKQGRDIDVE